MSSPSTETESEALQDVFSERLVFGWWNTSLSPVGIERSDEAHKEIAKKVVKSLIDDLKIDCLALGEVTDANLTLLKESCGRQTLTTYDGTLKSGKLQFDTGIIYDTERLAIKEEKSTVISHGGQNSKLANRIDFISRFDNSPFHIFVSHWPSRAYTEDNVKRRKTLATRLKDEIDFIRKSIANASIILMGDFNDEPFDESMSYHLLATRDRHLAITKEDFLYNPFWRQIGESEPHAWGNARKSSAGSCFQKDGKETRWRTFDQILFSPAFLGTSNWHLNEQETMILRTEFLVELVQNGAVHFDHLPVLSVIERRLN
jgi:hypothetical protein